MILSDDKKTLIINESEKYDVSRCFSDLENAKLDLDRFQKRVVFLEGLIVQARDLGYLTDQELDQIEQKKFAEERIKREEEERLKKEEEERRKSVEDI